MADASVSTQMGKINTTLETNISRHNRRAQYSSALQVSRFPLRSPFNHGVLLCIFPLHHVCQECGICVSAVEGFWMDIPRRSGQIWRGAVNHTLRGG
ncbi:hypothetical protein VTK73DRAFT_3594 [Phialemonium thermophilum]|uniref:Uncharacterized protein n=1 Tax=Phialemonium thermophilum TaxID=223376 RepID=A0ABR3WY92_9PEZI